MIIFYLSGEFDAEETKGSWGSKKKYFYGGNPNEKPKGSKHGKDPAEDENELVIVTFRVRTFSSFLILSNK